MQKIYLLIFILISYLSQAQKNINAVKITYSKSFNGTLIENQDPIFIYSDKDKTIISTEKILSGKTAFPFEQSYIERKNNSFIQSAQLSSSKNIVTIDSSALGKQVFEFLNDTKIILGYKCKKAKTIINSNTIELWYTNELNLKGAPTILGQNLGLVLELNRNNNFLITATKVEKLKAIPKAISFPDTKSKLDVLTYKDLLWKSKFKTLEIFKNEIIN
ncbi:GLPGLI family protein, partial [uncultured Flavobacterium sp.]|uniref:GLPGLI family protein n=1 Tax=uncultured Flavobacterium sp. TaxID=165435 RepID=UPI0025CEA0F2